MMTENGFLKKEADVKPNEGASVLTSTETLYRLAEVQELIEEYALTDTQTVHARAEDAAQNILYREQYDIATARAVATSYFSRKSAIICSFAKSLFFTAIFSQPFFNLHIYYIINFYFFQMRI